MEPQDNDVIADTSSVLWDLIKKNNHESVEDMLNKLDSDKRDLLLNGVYKCKIDESEAEEEVENEIDGNTNQTEKKAYKKVLDRVVSFVRRRRRNDMQDESRPLFTAIIFGSFDVLRVFLKYQINLLQVAEHGWNIIHYLIIVSHNDTNYEPKAVHIYKALQQELDDGILEALLMMEDKDGLRPLELAVHAGCIQIFNVIINTPGIYLYKRERKGLVETSWYDVNDYENYRICNQRRFSKSPIKLLSYLDRQVLKSGKTVKLLRTGMMKEWATAKIRCNIPFILIWFLLRLFLVMSFYVMVSLDFDEFIGTIVNIFFLYEGDQTSSGSGSNITELFVSTQNLLTNTTTNSGLSDPEPSMVSTETIAEEESTCPEFKGWYFRMDNAVENPLSLIIPLAFVLYLAHYLTVALFFDMISVLIWLFSRGVKWSRFRGKGKDLIVASFFYKFCQFAFLLWSLIYISFSTLQSNNVSEIIQHKDDIYQIFIKFGLMTTCFFSVWSILYFVQLLPSIGPFVNSIQKMLGIMMNFIIVYLIMLFPYPHAFLVFLTRGRKCQVDGFANVWEGMYSSFKIMLNMFEWDSSVFNNAMNYTFLGILHMLFVFVIAILLINFLIALLSAHVVEVVETGDVIMMLQRISVACLVETRLHRFCPCVYWLAKRIHFKVKKKKIYLVTSKITHDITD